MASFTPTITSTGIGSGLDVSSIVSQLVSAERTPIDRQLTVAQAKANTKISALGSFKGALSALQESAKALKTGGAIGAVSAQSSDNTIFTASAAAGTVSGVFDLEVVSLAKSSKLISGNFTNSSTSVGNGTITIGSGDTSFTVTLADGSNSLANLRDAINSATDNDAVNASIVNDVNGSYLVLSSRQSGAASAITVSSESALDSSPFFNTSVAQIAADAHVRIDGNDAYSTSNTLTGVIDGVTINLLKPSTAGASTLTLAADTTTSTNAIKTFIGNYNALVTVSNSLTKYDAATKSAGALLGDASVRGALQQLRGILGGSVEDSGSAYSQLSELGITTNTDGTLKLDATKLSAALTNDLSSVQKLFNADNGFANSVSALTKTYLDTGGQIDSQTQGLQTKLKDISKRQLQLDTRMDVQEARYRAQFTALDTLVSQLRSTQEFLTQQLSNLSDLANYQNK